MKSNNARLIKYDFLADDDAEEISSVRLTAVVDLDLEVGVEIDEFSLDRSFEDPTPVYARPYNLIGGQRCDFSRGHFLGTRFLGGIIESATWEQEMRDAGASELAIAQCRRYLADHSL
jgi:hypothetical protein